MHGRVKVRTTEEQKEIAKQELAKKAKSYRNQMDVIFNKRSQKIYDQETLTRIANLLIDIPDIITLWNYRREIMLHLKEANIDDYQALLEKDLNLTERCLRQNPKSYGTWHHRIWVLDNLPEPKWDAELKLCTKYLQFDDRNFHCWDYRRIIVERSNIPDLSEYEFTLKKIETNFSNYSAWHLRSKLLPKIFPDPDKKFPIDETKHKEELELVENAAFTDPNDQSAWFYLRWLLNLSEPKTCVVFVDASDEITIVISRAAKLNFSLGITVDVEVNGETAKGVWKTEDLNYYIWTFKPDVKLQQTDTIHLILKENNVEFSRQKIEPFASAKFEPNFLPVFSPNLKETLINQLSTCEQLLELEPDSKWTLLTSIFLMCFVDQKKYQNQTMEALQKLQEIDSFRVNYYKDLRNKILIESAIVDQFHSQKFVLSNQQLTSIYHPQYLFQYEDIDLSCNALKSECLTKLWVLKKCKCLNLSKNQISSVSVTSVLPKVETLLLDDNLIEEINLNDWEKFPCLKTISLKGNPIFTNENSKKDIISKLNERGINVLSS